MSTALLRWIIVAVAIFIFGWLANGWRLSAEIKEIKAEHAQAALEFQMRARVKEQQWQIKVEEARDEAKKREAKLSAAAAGARNSAAGLQRDVADLRSRLPELAEQAVRQYADSVSIVFGECTERLTAVAERADGHASDVQTLMDAWPR